MAAPICAHVREPFETMRYAVVEFFFVRVCLRIGFTDTLGNHFGIAFLMTSIFAIFALHPSRIFEKISAQSAAHDVVELLE